MFTRFLIAGLCVVCGLVQIQVIEMGKKIKKLEDVVYTR